MNVEDIIGKLPTREDVARLIGGRPPSLLHDELLAVVGVFGTGILLGAGLALLFAPRPGEHLRRDLAEKLGHMGGHLHPDPDRHENETSPSEHAHAAEAA